MKSRYAVIIAIFVLVCIGSLVRAEEGGPGWRADAGVSYLWLDPNLPRDLTIHTTHVDDQTFMTGSPGETDLSEVSITFLNLSLGYVWPIDEQIKHGWNWGIAYVLKIPVSEDGREEIQNENDTRPSTSGSYIYTKINEVEPQHEIAVDLSYWRSTGKIRYALTPRLTIGYWQLSFEKGWNRFGCDEIEHSSDAKGFSFFAATRGVNRHIKSEVRRFRSVPFHESRIRY